MNEKRIYQQAIKHLNNKEYTLAIVSFSELLEKGFVDSRTHYYIALCYSNLNYFKEALEEIELALKEDLEFDLMVQLNHLKGYIYYQKGELESAFKVYEKVLELKPENQIALSGIAYYYFKNNEYEKALRYYKKAFDLNPESAKTMNNYGYLLLLNNKDVEKAKKLCDDALKKQPNNPFILDSVAWCSFILNNMKKAVLSITKAFKSAANIEEIKEHYKTISEKVKSLIKK